MADEKLHEPTEVLPPATPEERLRAAIDRADRAEASLAKMEDLVRRASKSLEDGDTDAAGACLEASLRGLSGDSVREFRTAVVDNAFMRILLEDLYEVLEDRRPVSKEMLEKILAGIDAVSAVPNDLQDRLRALEAIATRAKVLSDSFTAISPKAAGLRNAISAYDDV